LPGDADQFSLALVTETKRPSLLDGAGVTNAFTVTASENVASRMVGNVS
jgi:hypothetical protein